MRSMFSFAVLLSATMLLAAEEGEKPTPENNDSQSVEQSFLGHWEAKSLTMSTSAGEKETFATEAGRTISVTFSKNTMTLQVGAQKFAEMPYTLNPQQTLAAIDAKYEGKSLLGIYKFEDNSLSIRLNDAIVGRPKTIEENAGIAINLKRINSTAILFVDANGVELENLEPMAEYSSCGSAKWSRDGSKIVYDAWRSWCGEGSSSCHIILVNPDGTSLKDLGQGALPSVSPDSKKITFCQYGSGVWVMNIDGSERKQIDAEGWSSDWTSNNDEVIYTSFVDGTANLRVTNIKTGETRLLFSDSKYQQIYWGLACSHDGKWIGFHGVRQDGEDELAIVGTERMDQGFKVLLTNDAANDVTQFKNHVSFTPDGKRIVALLRTEKRPKIQLYYLDIEGKGTPQWLSGQESHRQFSCCSFSPDGKKIVTIGKPAVKKAKAEKDNPATP